MPDINLQGDADHPLHVVVTRQPASPERHLPDHLAAEVRGDDLPGLRHKALLQGAVLWGPDSEVVVVSVRDIATASYRAKDPAKFQADVLVRCTNYDQIMRTYNLDEPDAFAADTEGTPTPGYAIPEIQS